MSKRVSKKGFKAWLESFAPQKVVGVPHDCKLCPLGRYDGGSAFKPGPWLPWVNKFTDYVDDSGLTRITAGRALKFLAKS